jgi:hypothetical protein
MAVKINEEGRTMKIAEIINQALEKKGFHNLKDAAKFLGISPELLRVSLNKRHIPKDKTLVLIANKLGLDKSILIMTAHREKVPAEMQGLFLSPSPSKMSREKRIVPLSEEQCDYLAKLMSTEEIQLLRKIRQVSDEAKTQIAGYVDFMYATKKGGRA